MKSVERGVEVLAATLGHSNTEVTARYGHLVPGEFSDADRVLVDLDLRPGDVVPLALEHQSLPRH